MNLNREDFRILEDGKEQEVKLFMRTNEPAHIALAVDTSGSTAELLPLMKIAAERFVNRFGPSDQIAVYGFASKVMRVCSFTGDFRKVKKAIGWLESEIITYEPKEAQVLKTGEGGTLLYDALALIRQDFPPESRKRAILVFTDSWDVGSDTSFDSLTWQILRGSEPLFPILVDLRESERFRFLKWPQPLDKPKDRKQDKAEGRGLTWAVLLDLAGVPSDGVELFQKTTQEFLDQLGRRDRVWLFVNRQRLYPLAFPTIDEGRPARVRPLSIDEARQLLVMAGAPEYSVGVASREKVDIRPDRLLILTDRDETGLPDLARFVTICPAVILKPDELTPELRKSMLSTFVHDPVGLKKLDERAMESVLRLMEGRMQRLARETGGSFFQVRGTGDLNSIYQQIADQIRSSYLLGYYTSGLAGLHRLEVVVPNYPVQVHTRRSVIVW